MASRLPEGATALFRVGPQSRPQSAQGWPPASRRGARPAGPPPAPPPACLTAIPRPPRAAGAAGGPPLRSAAGMPDSDPRPRLRGRRSEVETLDRLLEGVRGGQSRVLVLRGEAGVGKSALLEHLLARAPDCRIAPAAGVESD